MGVALLGRVRADLVGIRVRARVRVRARGRVRVRVRVRVVNRPSSAASV